MLGSRDKPPGLGYAFACRMSESYTQAPAVLRPVALLGAWLFDVAMSAARGLAELHEIMERLTMLARQGADAAVAEALLKAISPAMQDGQRRAAG